MTKSKTPPKTPTLTTSRLTLRAPKPEDAYERHRLGRDPEIILMFGYEAGNLGEYEIEAAQNWIENLSQHPCAWVIEHNEKFIGELRFDEIDSHDRRARLATGIYAADKLGQGFGRGHQSRFTARIHCHELTPHLFASDRLQRTCSPVLQISRLC